MRRRRRKHVTRQLKEERFVLVAETEESDLVHVQTPRGDPHNSSVQVSDGLIVEVEVVLLDGAHQLVAQRLARHRVAVLLQRDALENALGTLATVAVHRHAADLAAVDAVDDAAEERLAADGAVGGEHGAVEDLLLEVVCLLRVDG